MKQCPKCQKWYNDNDIHICGSSRDGQELIEKHVKKDDIGFN